tara:strand:+ start:1215 stop:1565 length:351 start_codon:yes stop_codon:yes gene_type:complete
MANFVSVNVTGNANHLLNGEHLINASAIRAVQQTADQTLLVTLDGSATVDVITLTASTVNDSGAPANPTYTVGAPLETAFNKALTANPGGVKASVNLGRDQAATPVPVYFVAIAYA